jgi:FAD/FMN-containing dehydrogenase
VTQPTPQSASLHTPHDLSALVHASIASKTPIVDYGIAHANLGNPPPALCTRLNLTTPAPDAPIIEHYVNDFTVRAWAGATLADLGAALAKQGQFLPIDADGHITLGEVINHNVFNALRTGYNAIRDISLGLHYIDGLGRDIHVGGRTVKNVAGYDVTRLMVGSLGQLGIVYEATVRTYALPKHVISVQAKLPDLASMDDLIPSLLQSAAAPSRLHASYTPDTKSWTLHVGYHGSPKACEVQSTALKSKLAPITSDIALESRSVPQGIAALTQSRAWRRSASAHLKLIVQPATTGKTADKLAALDIPNLHIDALPTHGILHLGGPLTPDQAAKLDHAAAQIISSQPALKIWHTRPPGASLPLFAPPQPDFQIIADLKKTMDPHNLFNPGRLV